MATILKAALTAVALLAFAIACDTREDSQSVKPGGTTPMTPPSAADGPTPTPKVVWVVPFPDNWPVPPLPVMWLEHESGPTRGSPQRYCWQFEDASDHVCEEYTLWWGVRDYPETPLGSHIPIRIDAETTPIRMFAQVFTRPGTIMVGGLRHLSTTSPGLDLAGLDPGVYNVRLIGHWHGDNRVAYEFGLSIPGAVKLKSECEQTLVDADPILTLESLDDRLRTAPDSSNSSGCRFNKRIARVAMILHNDKGSYTETFHIDPPSTKVLFPLGDDRTSEKSGDPLPPGQYSRRIVVIAEDGEELELRWGARYLVTLGGP